MTDAQCGVLSRAQLIALGYSTGYPKAQLKARRWQRIHPGVYASFTGPVPDRARVWAAVLHSGPGTVVAGRTALWLAGLPGDLPAVISLAVPVDRRVRPAPRTSIRRGRQLERDRHPAALPARLRVEPAVLDITREQNGAGPVVDLVIRVCQAGLTTAARLRAELATRPRQRWRSLLLDLLADVADGVQSPLERRYLQRVERAHGLPRGERNHQEGGPGTHLYRDVRYRQYCLLIELDGLEAHPGRHAHRDRRRDNRSARDEHTTLRYGWHEVTGEPCDVAVEVAEVLAARGWTDPPRRCGPGCTIPRDWPTTAS